MLDQGLFSVSSRILGIPGIMTSQVLPIKKSKIAPKKTMGLVWNALK
jgi:hypothetical protein